MNITIGEVINKLIPFSGHIDVRTYLGLHYIVSAISSDTGTAKLYLYVVQIDEHQYGCAVADDVYNGARYIPTGNSKMPFRKEKEFLTSSVENDPNVYSQMDFSNFDDWLYEALYQYDFISFNPKMWKLRLVDMGFNSVKIKRTLEREFNKNRCVYGNLKELIDLVNKKHRPFNLYGLADKELKCIYAKLKNIGLLVEINENRINKIMYERSNYESE